MFSGTSRRGEVGGGLPGVTTPDIENLRFANLILKHTYELFWLLPRFFPRIDN